MYLQVSRSQGRMLLGVGGNVKLGSHHKNRLINFYKDAPKVREAKSDGDAQLLFVHVSSSRICLSSSLLVICCFRLVDSTTNDPKAALQFEIDENDPRLVTIYWNQLFTAKKIKEISTREIYFRNATDKQYTEEPGEWEPLLIDEKDTRKVSRFVLLKHELCREKDFKVIWYDNNDELHEPKLIRLGPSPTPLKTKFSIEISNLNFNTITEMISGKLSFTEEKKTAKQDNKHIVSSFLSISPYYCKTVFNKWTFEPEIDSTNGNFSIPLSYLKHDCELRVHLNQKLFNSDDNCMELRQTEFDDSPILNLKCESVKNLHCPIEMGKPISTCDVDCDVNIESDVSKSSIQNKIDPNVMVKWKFPNSKKPTKSYRLRTAEVDYTWNNNPLAEFNVTTSNVSSTVGHIELKQFSKASESFYSLQICAVYDNCKADIDWSLVPKYAIYVADMINEANALSTASETETTSKTASADAEQKKTIQTSAADVDANFKSTGKQRQTQEKFHSAAVNGHQSLEVPLSPPVHGANSANPLYTFIQTSKAHTALVNTTSGWLQGTVLQMENATTTTVTVYEFLNISYGHAPVGNYRFAKPLPASYQFGIIYSNTSAPPCYQYVDQSYPGFAGTEMWNPSFEMTENCLNLNLWQPANAKNAPVLVWIFGGGFVSGSPSLDLYNGSTIAARHGIIVININYRLGPLGFLYLDDKEAPPNVGLLDQRLALQWIQENVQLFGGDPSRITLMGESAGAAAVMSHLLAKNSWHLFNNAILQSGTMNSSWATVDREILKNHSRELASSLGCSGSDLELLRCLRKLPAQDIQSKSEKMWNGKFLSFLFAPVINDELFFGEESSRNLITGNMKKTTILVCFNSDEGSFWLPTYMPKFFNNIGNGMISRTQFYSAVEEAFGDFQNHHQLERVMEYYLANYANERDALSAMIGDFYFTCDLLYTVHLVTEKGVRVYLSQFDYRSKRNPWPQWMGSMHGYEIEFIFGVPLRPENDNYSPHDQFISKLLMEYWSSFVYDSHPAANSTAHVKWPLYTVENPAYLMINESGVSVQWNPLKYECSLMRQLKLGKLNII
ncbi:Carboxylesterase [Trichinella nativa]|uniref:acetylcholinesterase n=1 Tax=Trichinella nativa TaxID=6335 RepID=A0A1Y3ED50_9BILA|nr:Carboxylesterase [Trichinella nativa]